MNEASVTEAIREHVPRPGAYFFPGLPQGEITDAQQRDFLERHRCGPIRHADRPRAGWRRGHGAEGSAFLVADVAVSWALAGVAIAAILPRRQIDGLVAS